MSTIIRDAIIRVKLEQHKSSLESGREGKWADGYREVKRAADESVKSQKESARQTAEFERTSTASNYRIVAGFREGGEGALRMARGIAFLSASGSDDLRKLAQSVAYAQGAFDVFAGSAKLFANLGMVFGPVGLAVAGVTTAVIAGAAAFKMYGDEVANATKRAEAFQKAQQDSLRVGERMVAQLERESGLRAELTGLAAEEAGIAAPGQLERQIAQQLSFESALNRELNAAAAREKAARDKNKVFDSTSAEGIGLPQVIQAEKEQFDILRDQLNAAKQRNQLQRQLQDEEIERMSTALGVTQSAIPGTLGFGGIPGLAAAAAVSPEIQKLTQQRDQLISEFADYHRDMINALRKQRLEINEVERELGDIRQSATK